MTAQGNHDQADLTLEYDAPRDQYVMHVRAYGDHFQAVLAPDAVEALADQARDLLDGKPRPQEPDMEVHVTRHRWANMGDHAVLAHEAVKYDPTETVEALILRVLSLQQTFQRHDPMDHITLRVVEGTEPTRKPATAPLDF